MPSIRAYNPEAAADEDTESDVDSQTVWQIEDCHLDMASTCWPRGAVLRCPTCDHTIEASVKRLARYLAVGWPACHGAPMHLCGCPARPIMEDASA